MIKKKLAQKGYKDNNFKKTSKEVGEGVAKRPMKMNKNTTQ